MRRMMAGLRRAMAEPVIQFLALGAVLYVVVGGESRRPEAAIHIRAAEQQQLRQQFARNHRRPPSEAEFAALIDQHIDARVLVREARRLGLDQADDIINRRLLQKMQFVLQARGQPQAPGLAELQRYFTDHPERYRQPARYSLEHIYFRAGASARARAETTLAQLPANLAEARPGDHFDRGYRFSQRTLEQLRDVFGAAFTAALADAEGQQWFGPLPSRYGQHLVRIFEHQAEQAGQLEQFMDQVRQDWMVEAQQRLIDDELGKIREAYRVRIESWGAP